MKKFILQFAVIIFFLNMNSILLSQGVPGKPVKYRPNDWISYPVMRHVSSLEQGYEYIYFGTENGICRYNLYENRWGTPFTRSNGMADDRVFIVFHDFKSGYLWCLTQKGLSYRLPNNEEWYNLKKPIIIAGRINALGSGDKYFWLRSGKKVYHCNRFGAFAEQSRIEEAEDDNVRWKGRGRSGDLPELFMDDKYFFMPEGYIKSIDLREYRITDTLRDKFQNLWIGTAGLGGGLANLNTYQLEMLPYGIYIPDVRAMAWDGASMWIGGHSTGKSGGITLWNMDENKWEYFESGYESSLLSDDVNDIYVENNSSFVWFATESGLISYDKNNNKWKVYNVFDNLWDNRVNTITEAGDTLWIGTVSGINMMLPGGIIEKSRIKDLDRRMIYRLISDDRGIWAGTDRGIYYYSRKKRTWNRVDGAANMVRINVTAIDVYDDEVWFGSDAGLEMYAKKEDKWYGFPAGHYPVPAGINSIINTEDNVWIASEKGVVKYVKKDHRWHRYTKKDGLIDNSVRWILPDGDYIWFGTGRGITRFLWYASYRID